MGGLIKVTTRSLDILNAISAAQAIQWVYHKLCAYYGSLVRILLPAFSLPPLVLRVRVTKKCNLKCNYCFQADSLNKKEEDHLTIDEWRKILSKLPPWTILDITGGEPFISKNFGEFIDLVLSREFKSSVITNGSNCDLDILENLVKKRLTYFMVSLDGLEETHNRIRGFPRSFQNAEKTILALQELKKKHRSRFPIICIKTTVIPENAKELEKLHDYVFDKLGVQSHSLNLLFQNAVRGGNEIYDDFNERFYSGNTLQLNSQDAEEMSMQIQNLFRKAKGLRRSIQLKPEIAPESLQEYFKNPPSFGVKKCTKVNSVTSLYFDGSLSPCDIGIRVSNIRELDFNLKKLWRAHVFQNFYQKFKSDGPFRNYCDGCCLMTHVPKAT